MPDAIAELSELIKSFGQCLLVGEARLKKLPVRFAQDRILNLAQICILKLSAQSLVVVQIKPSILFGRSLEPFIDLLEHVGGSLTASPPKASSIFRRRASSTTST